MSLFNNFLFKNKKSNIFEIPNETDARIGIVMSPDCNRIGYAVHKGSKMYVEVNGHSYHKYDAIGKIAISNDSIAYVAARKGRIFVVFNNQDHDSWDDIGKTSPIISGDSRRVAYTARRGTGWHAIIDGSVVGGPYEGFARGGILFSPDSRRFGYIAKRDDSWFVVVDGQEHNYFPMILHQSLTFSPDSRKISYISAVSGKWQGYKFVGEVTVIIDRTHLETWQHDQTTENDGLFEEITFSPDSSRLAYTGIRKGRCFVIVDETMQGEYDGFVSGWLGNQICQKLPDYGLTGSNSKTIVFSPDSRHIAYAVNDKSQHIFVVDGKEKARHAAILNQPPCFSADSKHLAYGIEENGKHSIVLDGQIMRTYEGLPPNECSFSPNSTMFAYAAWEGRGDCHALVIGNDILRLDGGFLLGARIIWDDNSHLHSLIAADRKIKRLQVVVDSSGKPKIAS